MQAKSKKRDEEYSEAITTMENKIKWNIKKGVLLVPHFDPMHGPSADIEWQKCYCADAAAAG